MAIVSNTNLVATKNDLIISLVQRELISRAVVMPSIADLSAFAGKGAKSFAVPRAGSFSVEDRASGAAAAQVAVTFATDTITVNQMSTVSWVVDPQDEIESSIDVQSDLAMRAAKAQAKNFDTLVIAGVEASATATTTAGAISKAIVLEMRKTLLAAEADPAQLTLLVGPDSEATLLGIAEFVEADRYGSAIIPNGVLGRLYGVQVVLSTQLAANTFYMYDRDGYGFGIQRALNMGERAAPEYGSTAVLKTLDIKWGHGELQAGNLLLKDNN
jgi:hypothetical protein